MKYQVLTYSKKNPRNFAHLFALNCVKLLNKIIKIIKFYYFLFQPCWHEKNFYIPIPCKNSITMFFQPRKKGLWCKLVPRTSVKNPEILICLASYSMVAVLWTITFFRTLFHRIKPPFASKFPRLWFE